MQAFKWLEKAEIVTKVRGFSSPFTQHTAKERGYFSDLLYTHLGADKLFCLEVSSRAERQTGRGPPMVTVTPLSLHTDLTMYKLLSNDTTYSKEREASSGVSVWQAPPKMNGKAQAAVIAAVCLQAQADTTASFWTCFLFSRAYSQTQDLEKRPWGWGPDSSTSHQELGSQADIWFSLTWAVD